MIRVLVGCAHDDCGVQYEHQCDPASAECGSVHEATCPKCKRNTEFDLDWEAIATYERIPEAS
jgi:hypothetical protein